MRGGDIRLHGSLDGVRFARIKRVGPYSWEASVEVPQDTDPEDVAGVLKTRLNAAAEEWVDRYVHEWGDRLVRGEGHTEPGGLL